MPLINCPDCNADVSDRSSSCIHCGCPIHEIAEIQSAKEDLEAVVARLKNSKKLKIGRQPINWSGSKDSSLNKVMADFEDGLWEILTWKICGLQTEEWDPNLPQNVQRRKALRYSFQTNHQYH